MEIPFGIKANAIVFDNIMPLSYDSQALRKPRAIYRENRMNKGGHLLRL